MRAVSILFLLVVKLGCLAMAAPTSGTLIFGGVERNYIYVVPPRYDGKSAISLVLIFHGAGNDGALLEQTLGFTELQREKMFLAVYPNGIDKAWNGGRTAPTSEASRKSDDVGFIAALIDVLERKFNIDPKRIFATGSSNGAMFCNTLAVRLSNKIAAIGPVICKQIFAPEVSRSSRRFSRWSCLPSVAFRRILKSVLRSKFRLHDFLSLFEHGQGDTLPTNRNSSRFIRASAAISTVGTSGLIGVPY
jgi:poly(3-hydroxybutyrate) depolymerase